MFMKKKSTNLEFIQKIEFFLGIYRNFNELKDSIKILVIIQIMITLILSLYGIQSFSMNNIDTHFNPQMFIPMMLYVISHFIEACIVQMSAIWFSSDYIELLKLIHNFEGIDKKKYSDVLLYGIVLYIISMLSNIAYKMEFGYNYFIIILEIISWYYILGSHLVQDAHFASLYITFAEITKSLELKTMTLHEEEDNELSIISVTVIDRKKPNINQLWVSYDKLIQCCVLFNKIFGYQVSI